MSNADYDLCIIGGGIHGAGIARDAAGRGMRVVLLEQNDLASATSSASSKMLHGGLRYLEYFQFRLVHEALKERETLLKIAPHVVKPMDFILPYADKMRPLWMIRLGLFLYDHLAGRKKLKKSQWLNLGKVPEGAPLKEQFYEGFSYADGWLDDSRLVVLNAMDAAANGAKIRTRTKCTGIRPASDHWQVSYDDGSGKEKYLLAETVVNAAGPWVRNVLKCANAIVPDTPQIRLVKGSHIVIPRIYEGEQGYVLQQPDRRIVFVWPYGKKYNYIGTTDLDFNSDPADVTISEQEAEYLCNASNRFFKKQVHPNNIVSSWSGVRTLIADDHKKASAVTRDYKLALEEIGGLTLLSVFGGKFTTYRRLAEKAVNLLTDKPSWTATRALPGGKIDNIEKFTAAKIEEYGFLDPDLVTRYAHSYGSHMDQFVSRKMGKNLGDHVFEAEIRYLIENEWAQTAEDILWRRSKLGLHVTPETVQNLEGFINNYRRAA